VYNRDKVTITGFVPVQSAAGETKLQFRIKGEIDRAAVRKEGIRRRVESKRAGRPTLTGAYGRFAA
jgi:hypothetical protein